MNKWQKYRLKDVDGYRERKREYAKTPEQRAKRTAYMREWRERNREKHNRQARESQHRNRHKHVDRNREYHLRRTFGIGLKEKAAMVATQDGACGICRKKFASARTTHIDHCHGTGKIRGVLCNACNTKLGWYELFADNIVTYLTW